MTRAPRLIAITDRGVATAAQTLASFERLARAALPESVILELRDRELPVRERLAFGRALKAVAVATEQWLGVNDRLDLALLLEAQAVHLGEASVSANDARRLLGAQCFVTRACHEPARALEEGVDGWVVSPIFAERKGRPPLGLGVLGEMHARSHGAAGTPGLYALGGVNAANARACVSAGALGVAVIGAVLASPDPLPLLRALEIAR